MYYTQSKFIYSTLLDATLLITTIIKIMFKKFVLACSSARSSKHHVLNMHTSYQCTMQLASCRDARDAMAAGAI
jgi:hypothetical protein